MHDNGQHRRWNRPDRAVKYIPQMHCGSCRCAPCWGRQRQHCSGIALWASSKFRSSRLRLTSCARVGHRCEPGENETKLMVFKVLFSTQMGSDGKSLFRCPIPLDLGVSHVWCYHPGAFGEKNSKTQTKKTTTTKKENKAKQKKISAAGRFWKKNGHKGCG